MEEKAMDEIKLTLDDAPAATAVALEAAPEEAAALTLDPETTKKAAAKYMEDVNLTPQEKQMIDDFTKKIDLSDSNIAMHYGQSCQQKIAEFSDTALEGVKTKDLGEVSNMLTNLVVELKGFDTEKKKKGLAGLFGKAQTNMEKLKAQYNDAEKNVDAIENALMAHQNQLNKDVVMMDKMYAANLAYFKELTMYIIAGKQKLEEERAGKLAELRKKAEETGLAEDAQAANDYNAMLERFEKKLYDLELTRNISIQMAPQIRMLQNNDVLMVERIQSTINNTIPLWKNQMVLALGMAHAQQATHAQHEVTELTNDLLKKNAETLKQGTIDVARESERAVVDIETLQETNQKLIDTFDEVLKIQTEGREKRANAENELGRIEAELKQKLLEINQ